MAVHPIDALQSEWSLWTREIEVDVLAAARELNIGIVPFSPLGRGALTGAISPDTSFGEGDMRSRMPRYQGDELRQNLRSVDELVAMAADLRCTAAQLALAWVLAQGPTSCRSLVPAGSSASARTSVRSTSTWATVNETGCPSCSRWMRSPAPGIPPADHWPLV